MFDPKDKVVCVDDKIHPEIAFLFRMLPEKNKVYTVRECTIGTKNPWNGNIHEHVSYKVLLEELLNDIDPCTVKGCKEEMGFASERFRLLDELSEEEKDSVLVGVGVDAGESWKEL
jgi:hypothetical protein